MSKRASSNLGDQHQCHRTKMFDNRKTAKGIMDVLLGVIFYIFNPNMSAKAVSRMKHMTVVSSTIGTTCIVNARSDELTQWVGLPLIITQLQTWRKQGKITWTRQQRGEVPYPFKAKASTMSSTPSTTNPPESRKEQMNKLTQIAKLHHTEENYWRSEVPISKDYTA